MPSPTVTVGIPYTDQGFLLVDAVTSVLNQTFTNWEMILYGDGPDDVTKEIASTFTDERIRHFVEPKRSGLAVALNAISKMAKGDFIARMDGDDLMHPERLEKQVKYLKTNPGLDVVGTHAFLIDETSQLMGLYAEPPLPESPRDFLNSNAFTHPTVMGTREWFLANKYDDSLLRGQDKELWLRTGPTSSFAKLNEPLFYYRISRKSSWRRQARNARYDRKIMRSYSHLTKKFDLIQRLLKSHVKQQIVFLLSLCGRSDIIYSRKYSQLSPTDHLNASATLESIRGGAASKKCSREVLAVTVTYGSRLHLVHKTVAGALDAGASEVLVVDNGMAPSDSAQLYSLYANEPKVSIRRIEKNEGSAPGFNFGLRTALESRYNYYWLLDDDNLVVRGDAESLVSSLVAARKNHAVVGVAAMRQNDMRHQKIVGGKPASLIYPPVGAFMYFDVLQKVRSVFGFRMCSVSDPELPIPTAPYGGLLVDRQTLEAVGLPNVNLGLYEDDTEWTSRIARAGKLRLHPCVVIEDLDAKFSETTDGSGPERLLQAPEQTRVFFAIRNRVNWEFSQASRRLLLTRYRTNRFIYLVILTLAAKKHGKRASLVLIKAAILAGESGNLDAKLTEKRPIL